MPQFKSDKLTFWHKKGTIKHLACRLGNVDIFCIDDNPNQNTDTILILHGFPTSSYDFAAIWPALRKHYRLVTLDMLGFGFSNKPNHQQYTIHQQADLFESLIEKTDLSSFHILAHDYGVSVAQELLARQLDSTSHAQCVSCTFLNGGLFPEIHRALLIQKLMLSPIGKWINKLAGLDTFSKSFSSVFGPDTQPSEEQIHEFWELICYQNGRHLFHNLITYILDRKQHRERWVNALQHSTVPLALINGSVDPVSGSHLVSRYKELGCRLDFLTELPTIGHYPQVEAPNEVAKATLQFLRGL